MQWGGVSITSFIPSVQVFVLAPLSFMFMFLFTVFVLFGGSMDSMFTSIFLPLQVFLAELFAHTTRVGWCFRSGHAILPNADGIRQ